MAHHSRYEVDATSPRARAVCDRCGFIYNHFNLKWQWQWVGPRLQNLRILVCSDCLDIPQPNLRTIVIPPDPLPIKNPRPENYVLDNNPLSAVGADANFLTPQYGSRIGNLTGVAGLNSAFDGATIKQSWMCAANKGVSHSSFDNHIGINWEGNNSSSVIPSSIPYNIITHTLSSVTVCAPSDRGFLGNNNPTTYSIQCSTINSTNYATWTTMATGTTAGSAGEKIAVTITSTFTNPKVQFHRVAFLGDAVNYTAVAQLQLSVGET